MFIVIETIFFRGEIVENKQQNTNVSDGISLYVVLDIHVVVATVYILK